MTSLHHMQKIIIACCTMCLLFQVSMLLYHDTAKILIFLSLLDTSKPIPKFLPIQFYAPFSPKIDKCIDDKDLAIFAHDELEDHIEKNMPISKSMHANIKEKARIKTDSWDSSFMDTQLANFSTNTLVAKYQTQDTMTESCDFDANQSWINGGFRSLCFAHALSSFSCKIQ